MSPFYNVKEPRQKKGEQKKKKKHDVLVQKDVDRLMEKAHSTEAKAYMAFLYFFALRNSEVCRLQKSHLTYHHGDGKDVKAHIVLSGLRVKGTEGENIIGEGHRIEKCSKNGQSIFWRPTATQRGLCFQAPARGIT